MSDVGSFEAFCEAEWARLVAALGAYTGDVATAEELAQEALTPAYQRWSRVSSLDSPGGWTRTVAINLARSQRRRRRAELRAVARAQRAADVFAATAAVDADDAVVVQDAVAALDDRQRQVIVCRFYLDMSVEGTATALRPSAPNVRVITHRALHHLAERIDRTAPRRRPVTASTPKEHR